MTVRHGRKAIVLLASITVASGTAVMTAAGTALATKPVFTKFPAANIPTGELTDLDGRLYMTTPAETLPDSIPSLVGIPTDGTLEFTGTDLIAGVERTIEVGSAPPGLAGCAPEAPDYVTGDCSRVQLTLISSDSEGGISFVSSLTRIEEGSVDRFRHPSGVIIDTITDNDNPDDPSQAIHFNGTQSAINTALANLRYTVGPDYHYTGTSPEITLRVVVISGDTSESITSYVQIRVLDLNGFPSHDGPDNAGPLLPQIEHVIPGFTVADSDNDEDAGDRADPEEPDEDLKDGPGANMMLIGLLDCGAQVAPNTGFHLASSTFQSGSGTVDEYLVSLLDGTPADTTDVDTYLNALRAGLDAIDPSIRNISLATSNPMTFTTAFAGITTMSEMMDALESITFLHDEPGDSCDLITIVLDLGNNGLPLKFMVSGENPDAIGWEVPMVGFDWNVLTITTDDLEEIDVSFDAEPLYLVEGDPGDPGDFAVAEVAMHISPATHPEFQILWDANPRVGDPEVSGVAQANIDFAGTSNNSVVIPANATTVTASIDLALNLPDETILRDLLDEGNETFEYEIVPDQYAPPAGYTVTSSTPTRTVVIVDDDDAERTVAGITGGSVTEGDSGTKLLNFTVSLDGPADGYEQVTVATTDGSATDADDDYEPVNAQVVSFAPGETSRVVAVTINGDPDDEPDETFTLAVTVANIAFGNASATGTILNDDDTRTVTAVSAPATLEGNPPNNPTMAFTITLDNPAKAGDSLRVNTSGATPGVDYTAITDLVVALTPGSTTTVVPVTISGDTEIEADEVITLTLDQPSPGVALGVSSGTGTIVNDDGIPTATIDDVTIAEGDAGLVPATFTISLSEPAAGVEQVTVATANVSATGGSDFQPGSQTITFAPGDVSGTFTVNVLGDTDPELDETFDVGLTNPIGLLIGDGGAPGVGTIVNDDITVSITPTLTIPEGDSDTAVLAIAPATHPAFTVTVDTANGTASTSDFDPLSAVVVNVPANGTTVPITLTTVEDPLFEGDETFTVTVSPPAVSPPGFTVRPPAPGNTSTVTIADDDTQPALSVADLSVAEGDTASVPLTTTNPGHDCVVIYTTSEGTALEPEDFTATSGQATVGAPTTIDVPTVDDSDVEGAHTFTVTITLELGGDPACSIGIGSATVTIVDDDDPAPTLSITGANVTEGTGAGTTTLSFTVTTSGVQSADCGFGVALTHVTSSNADLTSSAAFPMALTFTTADLDRPIDVGITRDATDEPNETFTLTLTGSGPTPCAIGAAASATGTIVDDDDPPPDDTDPLALDVPDDITRNNDPGQAGAVVAFTATASGGVPPIVVVCSPTSGAFFPIGATSVTCVATDSEQGQQDEAIVSGAFTVTVIDAEPPTIADLPDLSRMTTDTTPVAVTFPLPVASDNSGVAPTVACSPSSGTAFPVGVTTVTCTATDGAGLTASSSFTVTVTSTPAQPPAPATPTPGLPATGASAAIQLAVAALLVALGVLGVALCDRRRRWG